MTDKDPPKYSERKRGRRAIRVPVYKNNSLPFLFVRTVSYRLSSFRAQSVNVSTIVLIDSGFDCSLNRETLKTLEEA